MKPSLIACIFLWLFACSFPLSAESKSPLEKGFYATEGLDVDIRQRIPDVNNIKQVLKGESEYGIADSGLLLDKLNAEPVKALADISDYEKQTIQNRWLGLQAKQGIQTEIIIQYGIVVFAAFLVFVFWNRSLQRQIKRRKQMAAALRQSEAKFRTLYEFGGEAVLMLDQNSFFDCNKASITLFGLAMKENICSYHPGDLSPPKQPCGMDSRTLANQYIATAMEKGSLRFEWTHKRIDTGKTFTADVLLNALTLDGKTVLQATVRDITERKKAEKLLASSENKYRTLVDLAGDAIFLADADTGILIDCNVNATKLTGKTKEELIGRHQSELHPAGKAELYKKLFKEHVENSKQIVADVVVQHKDGHTIPVDIRGNVFELDGSIVALGVFRDITERKLIETESRIAATVFESQEGMMITDANGIILKVNHSFTRITGYSSEEVIGKNPRFLSSGRHDMTFYAYLWKSVYQTGSWQGEIWNKRKNGDCYPEWLTITAVKSNHDEVITHYVAIFVDITEHKRAEQAMQEAELKANLANQAKSEFLANMSHEIRTPMNAIIGMTQLAQRTELTPKQRNYLNKINYASQSLLSIINDILDFSKIEAGRLELESLPFSLDELLLYVDDMITLKAEQKHIVVSRIVDPKTPKWLIGDTLRLSQVLINLVSNAVKFTEKGKIIVAIMPEKLLPDSVCLRFAINDSGIGMSEEQIAELFQPFSQGDTSVTRKYGGTGLGLFVCKQLVEIMKGQIWAESQLGKGSTFTFTVMLGIARPPAKFSTNAAEQGNKDIFDCLSGHKVLLVEDNDINRELAIELLTNLGIVVEIATNGREGVQRVFAEPFDLVLMDIQMPEMDGLTATRLIRAEQSFSQLPIIAMTANAMDRDKEQSLAAGMNDHLTKPIIPEKLARVLCYWLADKPVQKSALEQIPKQFVAVVAENDLPEHLPPFDIAAALLRVRNNSKLMRKLLLMFDQEYSDAIPKLKKMLLEEQHEEAIRLAHTIKGAALNLEAKEVAAAAKAVENALREGEMATITDLIEALDKELTLAFQAVKTLE